MNHMTEVAKMLDVELGEEFMCSNGYKYVLTEDGITEPKYKNDYRVKNPFIFAPVLDSLLSGALVIKRKSWKPSEENEYWYIASNGSVDHYYWTGDPLDFLTYKLGNCYKTAQEAEANRDKWVAFYASDEVLEV